MLTDEETDISRGDVAAGGRRSVTGGAERVAVDVVWIAEQPASPRARVSTSKLPVRRRARVLMAFAIGLI
ncbi:hypothetical protein ACNKHW_17350 [Shigella flexneri]